MDLIQTLRARRAAIKAELEALTATAEGESRGFNEAESADFDVKLAEMNKLDARIAELTEAEAREAAAAETRKEIGVTYAGEGVKSEPNPVYRKGDHSTSFFRDLAIGSRPQNVGFSEARARLASSQETRANDMTSVAGAGGEFAPPLWLIEDFVALARPGRVTADLVNNMELPKGISSVNLPKVASGATTAVQATQGTAVSDTAMTTTSVSSGITSIAGKQIISQQLLDQSGIPFDRVILGDLARAYAAALDVQVLTGTNASGQLNGLSNAGTTITWTTASASVYSSTAAQSFYHQVAYAIEQVQTTRYLPPTAIVMHPRRWTWVLEAADSQSRPFVVPNGPQFNGLGTFTGPAAEGPAGALLGLPVYVDPNIPTNIGAATNQDQVFILRADDIWLWETALQAASFDATYADQLSVLYRVHGYSALIANRFAASVQVINGTGLVAPTLH